MDCSASNGQNLKKIIKKSEILPLMGSVPDTKAEWGSPGCDHHHFPCPANRSKKKKNKRKLDAVATDGGDHGGGEAGSSRLHVFLSSLLASIGGVFAGNHQEEGEGEEEETEMASSSEIAPTQEPHREDVKKQKEGGNRRALQEISNLVNPVDGNHHSQTTLPITKSFVALSLANHDPYAAAKNNEKILKQKFQGGEGAKGELRPQKKVTYKPESDTVIIISSDEVEECKDQIKEETILTDKNCTSGKVRSSRKKINSLTSVLTARSKAACGVESRPREQIVDIDAADVNNELAVVEYVEDIYKFYRLSEGEYQMYDYMRWQPNITQKMRMILIDWLIEVHNKFELLPETLYLTIDLVDRYLSRKVISRRELQLVGISSMLLACKYEEIWAPEVDDFICISDRAYSREQVLAMEKSILSNLEWNLTVATPYVFLVRFIKATVPSNKQIENMAFFLAESGLMHYDVVLSYRPSLIAAAAVYAALRASNQTPGWTETLRHYTGYADHEIKRCADKLVSLLLAAKKSNLKAVCTKFIDPDRAAVALLPLAK